MSCFYLVLPGTEMIVLVPFTIVSRTVQDLYVVYIQLTNLPAYLLAISMYVLPYLVFFSIIN